MLSDCTVKAYTEILEYELQEATGCTEPIALALAGAKCRKVLGCLPEKVEVFCSGNIIKNVKAVVVPNSGGLRGIDVAVLLGMIGGDSDRSLQVISDITDEHRKTLRHELLQDYVHVHLAENVPTLYIRIEAEAGQDSATVEIQQSHHNFTEISKNGEVISRHQAGDEHDVMAENKELMNVRDILEYAETADVELFREVIERQIRDNTAICAEGLKNPWGEQVGRTLLDHYGNDSVRIRARAAAAAGSDARMNGCPMPVVINSGSGNQGMTVSLPVIEYAKTYDIDHEKLLRALALANLLALHQKRYIGYLSAYCGAVSAAAGAVCGICWLKGGTYQQICDTLSSTIATIGGMVCDGAKSSCAGKISMSVECGWQSMEMAMEKRAYRPGEGLVKKDIEKTIESYGRMARDGMAGTDVEILNIMLEK